MWILFSFLIAILESSKDLIGRSTTDKISPYVSAFGLQLFAAIVLLPVVIITGIPEIKPAFWWASIFTLFSIPAWSILYMKALTLSPLHISVPMLAFNPIITAITSIFFDHRFPSVFGWIGIIFICVGLYLIRLRKETIKKGFLYPIINIKNEPGALAMLGVAFIWGVGTHVAKIITNASSPLMFAFSITVLGSIILFVIGKIKAGLNLKMVKDNLLKLGPLGFLNGLAELVRGFALQTGYTPYVVAIARSNIVASSLLGSFIYKDKLSVLNVIGLLMVFMGIILVIFQ